MQSKFNHLLWLLGIPISLLLLFPPHYSPLSLILHSDNKEGSDSSPSHTNKENDVLSHLINV